MSRLATTGVARQALEILKSAKGGQLKAGARANAAINPINQTGHKPIFVIETLTHHYLSRNDILNLIPGYSAEELGIKEVWQARNELGESGSVMIEFADWDASKNWNEKLRGSKTVICGSKPIRAKPVLRSYVPPPHFPATQLRGSTVLLRGALGRRDRDEVKRRTILKLLGNNVELAQVRNGHPVERVTSTLGEYAYIVRAASPREAMHIVRKIRGTSERYTGNAKMEAEILW
jgi:hypothetical protein